MAIENTAVAESVVTLPAVADVLLDQVPSVLQVAGLPTDCARALPANAVQMAMVLTAEPARNRARPDVISNRGMTVLVYPLLRPRGDVPTRGGSKGRARQNLAFLSIRLHTMHIDLRRVWEETKLVRNDIVCCFTCITVVRCDSCAGLRNGDCADRPPAMP